MDAGGRSWLADQQYSSAAGWGFIETDGNGGWARHQQRTVAGTQEQALAQFERWGMEGYRFDVPNGTYDVRLHFAETTPNLGQVGRRVFDVAVQGQMTASRLDITAEAGFATALVRKHAALR